MLTIKTEIGNFGDWHSVYMEMVNTNTNKVLVNCSYCFQHIGTYELTLADVQTLDNDNLLDDDTVDTIKKFVQAVKQLTERNN